MTNEYRTQITSSVVRLPPVDLLFQKPRQSAAVYPARQPPIIREFDNLIYRKPVVITQSRHQTIVSGDTDESGDKLKALN
jgi:hypothetical protein